MVDESKVGILIKVKKDDQDQSPGALEVVDFLEQHELYGCSPNIVSSNTETASAKEIVFKIELENEEIA